MNPNISHPFLTFHYPYTTMYQCSPSFPFAREPVLRRMPDGSLLALMYTGGTQEPSRENVVAAVRSQDDGATWSAPEVLFRHPFRSCWSTELFTEGERPFLVFQTYDFRTYYSEVRAFVSHTGDSGRTWSEPASLPGIPPNVVVRQGKVLSDGTWLFPVYWTETRGDWQESIDGRPLSPRWNFCSGVLRSADQGRTFTLHGCLRNRGHLWEPEVAEIAPGRLWMLLRSEEPGGVLWESESLDGGRTWSAARPGAIPNPGTKVVLYRVRDRWALVNNVCTPERKLRNDLQIWVSDDGCRTWRKRIPLAWRPPDVEGDPKWDAPDAVGNICYPHGFADDAREQLYLALDGMRQFFLVKVPYADLLA